MTQHSQQKGFTLVELAIVLTIIGLLIGGILKGQQLMSNARVTATMAQINAIESAATTFRDTYGFTPGDMPAASTRIAGCLPCNPTTVGLTGVAGDTIVGMVTWPMSTIQQMTTLPTAGPHPVGSETVLFWVELAKAGLISGINDDGITAAPATLTFGGSHPAARIGGGWIIGNSTGSVTWAGRPAGAMAYSMTGAVLMLTSSPIVAPGTTAGAQPLTPSLTAQMDRKMDDGLPNSGFIQAYGVNASCYSAATPWNYNELVNSRDCGLYFRIQG